MTTRPSRCSPSSAALLVLALAATPVAIAHASPFSQKVAEAQKRYLAGDYPGAIDLLESAYRVKPAPRLLFDLGMAHRKLGHAHEALDLFERYRVEMAGADPGVPLDRYLEELRRELAPPVEKPVEPPSEPAPPPTPLPPPPEPTRPPAAAPLVTAPAPTAPPPRHRWLRSVWLWTGLATLVTAAIGVGLGLGLPRSSTLPPTLPDIGPGAHPASPLVRW